MFVDNGNQLKNYGMQLQNMGMEIQNYGIQMKNNVMQNIGNQMQIQNIGNQIHSMGLQISNIAMQIFNMGVQISNIIMNQNNVNMMNQNDLMNNFNMMMNGVNETMNDNYVNSNIRNFLFITQTGHKKAITMNENRTVGDLLNLYLEKMGLSFNDIQKQNIYFVFNGEKIDINDKRKIKQIFRHINENILVENF